MKLAELRQQLKACDTEDKQQVSEPLSRTASGRRGSDGGEQSPYTSLHLFRVHWMASFCVIPGTVAKWIDSMHRRREGGEGLHRQPSLSEKIFGTKKVLLPSHVHERAICVADACS